MPRISTVGSGHGSPDYATLAAWWAAESGTDYSGLPIIAECLGNCGDNFTLSGTSVNGAEIYTQGVTYDGTNQSSLAIITRLDLNAVINIHDVYLLSDNNFDFILELDAGADGSTIESCYLYHSGTPSGVDAVATNGSQPSTQILNCVINCNGCVNGFDLGFNHALQIKNNVIFGASGDGIEGSGDSASLIIQNNFCFNNGASDYSNIGASATFTNNASEDLTGQETGYTSSELVDFAGGDYRTKSSSALATLGTGGSFIGAFLEAGGGGLIISPTGIATAEVFGSPTLTVGAVTINATAIPSAEVFGSPTVTSGGAILEPTAIATAEAFGLPVLAAGAVLLEPTAIDTEEALGTPVVVIGTTFLSPESIGSEEAFGTVIVERLLEFLSPIGIPSASAFGQPVVIGGDRIVIPVEDRATWNRVAKYLRTLSFTGSDNDVICAWLRSEGYEDQYNDMWDAYLTSNGFVLGALADKYSDWKAGLNGNAFWILNDGTWNDSNFWIDSETWRDS